MCKLVLRTQPLVRSFGRGGSAVMYGRQPIQKVGRHSYRAGRGSYRSFGPR